MPRGRSESAHKKVMQAAILLIAKQGIDATSMDAIAQKSGVSKATIYKHWSDKDALLLEVMAEVNGLHQRPVFDSGKTLTDIAAVLAYRPKQYASVREKIMPHFMVHAAHHKAIGMVWRNMVMDPPRRELRHLLSQGMAKGEISAELDMELAIALLLGPIMYWFIFLRDAKEDPRALAEGVADAFWRAFRISERTGERPDIEEKTALADVGLDALLTREAGKRLAALGGSHPKLKNIPRRRPS